MADFSLPANNIIKEAFFIASDYYTSHLIDLQASIDERLKMIKILIVEDDAVSRLVLKNTLHRVAVYEVLEANSGGAAWELMEKGLTPDLCISDIMMPDISGLQLIEKMRQVERLAEVPIILCSRLGDRPTVETAASLHVQHYILKPYSPNKVLTTVKTALYSSPKGGFIMLKELAARMHLEPNECAQVLNGFASQIECFELDLRDAVASQKPWHIIPRIKALENACISIGDKELLTVIKRVEASLEKGEAVTADDLFAMTNTAHHLREMAQKAPLLQGDKPGETK